MSGSIHWRMISLGNLTNGVGGVEVHVRSLARELRLLSIEPEYWEGARAQLAFETPAASETSDVPVVLHTHGDSFPLTRALYWRCKSLFSGRPRALWVHTQHGSTWARMRACREWFWLRGYVSVFKELFAVLGADLVFAVHPLALRRFGFRVLRLGRPFVYCGNGWDSAPQKTSAHASPIEVSGGAWVFVGRGSDRVKGVDRLIRAWVQVGRPGLIAIPGEGFEGVFPGESGIQRMGVLEPEAVHSVLGSAEGFILTSRYEGNSLAVLEALAQGAKVVSTPVGLARELSVQVAGLYVARSGRISSIVKAWQRALDEAEAVGELNKRARTERATHNRRFLPRWADVAAVVTGSVRETLRTFS